MQVQWWGPSNPTLCKKNCLNFFELTGSGHAKTLGTGTRAVLLSSADYLMVREQLKLKGYIVKQDCIPVGCVPPAR